MHISYIRPHPPRRNPPGYHDLYSAEEVGPFTGFATPEGEAAFHPLNAALLAVPRVRRAPTTSASAASCGPPTTGRRREVDDQLARLLGYLDSQGLAADTLVVLTSDHGEMGGDHWLLEKCGYWDESFHIPADRAGPGAGGRRHPGPGRAGAHRVGGRGCHHPGVAGPRGPGAGGRLAAHPFLCAGGRAPAHWRRWPTGNGTSAIPSCAWPSGTSASRVSTARWPWRGARTPSTSSLPPTPRCCRRCFSTLERPPGRWRTWPAWLRANWPWRRRCCAGGRATWNGTLSNCYLAPGWARTGSDNGDEGALRLPATQMVPNVHRVGTICVTFHSTPAPIVPLAVVATDRPDVRGQAGSGSTGNEGAPVRQATTRHRAPGVRARPSQPEENNFVRAQLKRRPGVRAASAATALACCAAPP